MFSRQLLFQANMESARSTLVRLKTSNLENKRRRRSNQFSPGDLETRGSTPHTIPDTQLDINLHTFLLFYCRKKEREGEREKEKEDPFIHQVSSMNSHTGWRGAIAIKLTSNITDDIHSPLPLLQNVSSLPHPFPWAQLSSKL